LVSSAGSLRGPKLIRYDARDIQDMETTTETGYRVLVAHGNEDVLDSVKDYFEREPKGFVVTTASSVQEALEAVREQDIDCVVTGKSLNGGDGVELLGKVRNGGWERLPFVLFVGEDGYDDTESAVEAGATDYVKATVPEFVAAFEDPGREQQENLADRVQKVVDRERMRTNYREVFNKANDAIFVENPETGEILDVNQRMCEMHGYTREEAVGLHVNDVSADEGEFTPERAMENLQKATEEGSHVFEWKNKTKDGETFWVEVSLKGATISGKERILAVVRDISERKEYEKRLEKSERRFRELFEKHSAPMLLIDPDSGEIANANEAATELYGYGREELTSMRIDDINALSDEEVEKKRQEVKSGDRDSFVFPHEKKDGEVIEVVVNSIPVETEGDTVLFSIIHEKNQS
jgi:PAS domain S-box-containing protein